MARKFSDRGAGDLGGPEVAREVEVLGPDTVKAEETAHRLQILTSRAQTLEHLRGGIIRVVERTADADPSVGGPVVWFTPTNSLEITASGQPAAVATKVAFAGATGSLVEWLEPERL